MEYLPRVVGTWDETEPGALARFSDDDLDGALAPLYGIFMSLPVPLTRGGFEESLHKLGTWLRANKHPLSTPDVSLEALDIAMYEGAQMRPDKLLVAAEVGHEGWEITYDNL